MGRGPQGGPVGVKGDSAPEKTGRLLYQQAGDPMGSVLQSIESLCAIISQDAKFGVSRAAVEQLLGWFRNSAVAGTGDIDLGRLRKELRDGPKDASAADLQAVLSAIVEAQKAQTADLAAMAMGLRVNMVLVFVKLQLTQGLALGRNSDARSLPLCRPQQEPAGIQRLDGARQHDPLPSAGPELVPRSDMDALSEQLRIFVSGIEAQGS